MPQASDELRAEMDRLFGDPVDDVGPTKFLKDHGYTLRGDWRWEKPGVLNYGHMTQDEYFCLLFLVHEWDFGGLKEDQT